VDSLLKLGGYQIFGSDSVLSPSFYVGLQYFLYQVFCKKFVHYWNEEQLNWIGCRTTGRFLNVQNKKGMVIRVVIDIIEFYNTNILLFYGDSLLKQMNQVLSLYSNQTQYK
jgi:hypothetical protein